MKTEMENVYLMNTMTIDIVFIKFREYNLFFMGLDRILTYPNVGIVLIKVNKIYILIALF